MLSLRIETIASFVSKENKVVDVGCDHAYLAIHLVKKELCESVIATDVNLNALENAKKNIKEAGLQKKIPTFLSNGIAGILDKEFDTLVISGMGTATILKIMQEVNSSKVKKLIIQSNNDLYLLRTSLEKCGYFLEEEKVVYEKRHYYVIGHYNLSAKPLSLREKLFGKYDAKNKEYYQFLNEQLHIIYKKIRNKSKWKKIKLYFKIQLLKKYL